MSAPSAVGGEWAQTPASGGLNVLKGGRVPAVERGGRKDEPRENKGRVHEICELAAGSFGRPAISWMVGMRAQAWEAARNAAISASIAAIVPARLFTLWSRPDCSSSLATAATRWAPTAAAPPFRR